MVSGSARKVRGTSPPNVTDPHSAKNSTKKPAPNSQRVRGATGTSASATDAWGAWAVRQRRLPRPEAWQPAKRRCVTAS
jgi:hypothetical protein